MNKITMVKKGLKGLASFGVGLAIAVTSASVKSEVDRRIDETVDGGVAMAKKLYKEHRG